MPNLREHFNINNLHHAYLIEGERENLINEVVDAIQNLGVVTTANPDFYNLTIDTIKIEDARNFNNMRMEKGFSPGKKIFLISTNSILLDAQNAMLKMFEDPIEDTHFFILVPDASALLKTFVSRFYLISPGASASGELVEAERFIKMRKASRIEFLKDFLAEPDEEDLKNSVRSNAIKFLNGLEVTLHRMSLKNSAVFHQIFRAREFLRMPGSSTKSLLESVALAIPEVIQSKHAV